MTMEPGDDWSNYEGGRIAQCEDGFHIPEGGSVADLPQNQIDAMLSTDSADWAGKLRNLVQSFPRDFVAMICLNLIVVNATRPEGLQSFDVVSFSRACIKALVLSQEEVDQAMANHLRVMEVMFGARKTVDQVLLPTTS